MEDYTRSVKFWKRLKAFVDDVQVNDFMSDEEKDMILYNCKKKIHEIDKD